jgi:hypothetical protein
MIAMHHRHGFGLTVAIQSMTHIELPRAVEAYFAFAELPATERGRHFTITFTYMDAGRLDRLQWWWQVSKAQERAGDAMVQGLRNEAVLRFRQHIERWLVNSNRSLKGGDPFPHLEGLTISATAGSGAASAGLVPAAATEAEKSTREESAYVESVREYARMAVGS